MFLPRTILCPTILTCGGLSHRMLYPPMPHQLGDVRTPYTARSDLATQKTVLKPTAEHRFGLITKIQETSYL